MSFMGYLEVPFNTQCHFGMELYACMYQYTDSKLYVCATITIGLCQCKIRLHGQMFSLFSIVLSCIVFLMLVEG